MSISTPALSSRGGALALAAAGLLFFLYPAVRPWGDETTLEGAAGMASTAWVASHLFAAAGFILFTLALVALHGALGGRTAARALVTGWFGTGLTLPFYGQETFALHAIGTRAVVEGDVSLMTELRTAIAFHPAAATTFAAGLLLLGVSATLLAVAIWRSGPPVRWAGVPLAAGFALFIPQFLAGPPIRVAHGLLMAAGALWIAAEFRRAPRPAGRPSTAEPAAT